MNERPKVEPEITSPANPRVRAWLQLRDRRHRDRTGRTLVDGLREIGRALDGGAALDEAIVGPSAASSPEALALMARLRRERVPLVPVSSAVEDRLGFGDRVEGIVAVARIPSLSIDRIELPPDPLVLVVEGVEKPGNLGAVLRSADGAGADAVIAADPRTDLYNPNAIRASLGTIFGMRLAAAPSVAVLDWCRANGLRLVAARVDGTIVHTDADLRGPLAILLGSEAGGLSETWAAPDVLAVRLPMLGVADSLNVSVAGAVLLYEALRQRGPERAAG
jgi:TrmH family RNA methyltransferase